MAKRPSVKIKLPKRAKLEVYAWFDTEGVEEVAWQDTVSIYIQGRSLSDAQCTGIMNVFRKAAKEAGITSSERKYTLEKSFFRQGIARNSNIKIKLWRSEPKHLKNGRQPHTAENIEKLKAILPRMIRQSGILASRDLQ